MKADLLIVASSLEDVQRDLGYLDPEDMDSELPEIVDKLEAAFVQLMAIIDRLPEVS